MIKCLLSYETNHYVVYLKPTNDNQDYLSFQNFKEYLISHYNNLIQLLKLDFENDRFEIYDQDFDQFVIVDRCVQIKNLSKLKVIKTSNVFSQFMNNKDCSNHHHLSSNNSTRSIQNGQAVDLNCSIRTNNQSNNQSNSQSNMQLNKSKELNQINVADMNNKSNDDQLNKSNQINRNYDELNKTKINSSIESNKSIQQSTKNAPSSNRSQNDSKNDNLKSSSISFDKINAKSTVKKSVNLVDVGCQTKETEFRIIHLKDNPFKENCLKLKTDYNRLIEENKRLNAKLELYKQGSVANATNYLDDFVYNADTIEKLEKELNEAKAEQKTIMEAFKKKSKEFRRVVYLLTGFKFDALEQRKYRVSHIYSNPNDYLFFTFEKEDVINLLGNEFSEKFYDLYITYLKNQDSFPSFLASITIKLFKEKQENSKKELN